MAAPASKTIGDINGKWVMNKTLSDSPEPALALQGVGWLIRKAIGAATVTLHVKQYTDDASVPHIDVDQIASGGIKGTSENRTLDFQAREHSDWLFGRVTGQSKFVTAEELQALVAPDGEPRTQGWIDDDFVAQDWIEADGEKTGPAGETHVYNLVKSVDKGWTVVQVWGFQMIGGERRYTRNIVCAKGDKFEKFKLIFDWVSAEW
ncbi:hypothetical protein F5Y19DRAFT_150807 [Xylariaceae sp. FL1651]|nr:hypothetical protein F5Y19DRAFT_150807 [Xylariaceae sp. FL1651]